MEQTIFSTFDKGLYRINNSVYSVVDEVSSNGVVNINPDQISSGGSLEQMSVYVGAIVAGKQGFTNNETGYILGIDADDGKAKFYIGNTTNYLNWDGVNLVVSGNISATTGSIGGFTIGVDYIRDTANSFGLASTVTGGDDVRFWAGDTYANRATAPFRVTESGVVVANTITATGTINALGGYIGQTSALLIESTGLNVGTVGHIRGGQTDYNTGTGWFAGYSGGQYKLSFGDPAGYRITWDGATLTVVGTVPDTQTFTADGTWTKPAGAKFVRVVCIGGGGSGGGGSGIAAGNYSTGGSGGGAGSYIEKIFNTSDITGTVNVTVGTTTTGGAGGVNADGSDGTAGNNSSFGAYLIAYGGGAGFKGTASSGAQTEKSGGGGGGTGSKGSIGVDNASSLGGSPAVTAGVGGSGGQGGGGTIAVGTSAEFGGGSGGSGSDTAAGAGGSSIYGPGGGGGGGGKIDNGTECAGGAGGAVGVYTIGGGGTAGAANGGVGGNGADGDTTKCGQGGGGGGGQGSGTGGAGGNGGVIGGGGGGGAGGTNTGGAGGNGGRGQVIIYTS